MLQCGAIAIPIHFFRIPSQSRICMVSIGSLSVIGGVVAYVAPQRNRITFLHKFPCFADLVLVAACPPFLTVFPHCCKVNYSLLGPFLCLAYSCSSSRWVSPPADPLSALLFPNPFCKPFFCSRFFFPINHPFLYVSEE